MVVDRQVLQGRGAVQDHVDGHPLAAQAGGQRRGQDLVVLGHQNPHRPPAASCAHGLSAARFPKIADGR
jgi:hypothetical protein